MATAWALYHKAKKKIGNGTITLGANINRIQLHTSASNASSGVATLSTATSVDNEVSNGNGYTSGGKTMGAVTWTQGATTETIRFDCSNLVWTASGGAISNIKYALIRQSTGDHAICYSRLSTSQFDISDGNTLTLQLNSNGIFQMT